VVHGQLQLETNVTHERNAARLQSATPAVELDSESSYQSEELFDSNRHTGAPNEVPDGRSSQSGLQSLPLRHCFPEQNTRWR